MIDLRVINIIVYPPLRVAPCRRADDVVVVSESVLSKGKGAMDVSTSSLPVSLPSYVNRCHPVCVILAIRTSHLTPHTSHLTLLRHSYFLIYFRKVP